MSKPNYLEIGEAYDKLLLDFVKVSRENAELKRVRISEDEVMEQMSGQFLTRYLPTDHTEWSDTQLFSFLNEHVVDEFEDYEDEQLLRLIEEATDNAREVLRIDRAAGAKNV